MEKLEYTESLNDLKKNILEAKEILSILNPLTKNGEQYKILFTEIEKKLAFSYDSIKKSKSANTKYLNDLIKTKDEIKNSIEELNSNITIAKSIVNNLSKVDKKSIKDIMSIEKNKELSLNSKKEIISLKNSINRILKTLKNASKKSENYLKITKSNNEETNKILKVLILIKKQADKNINEITKFHIEGKEKLSEIKGQLKSINIIKKEIDFKSNSITDYYNKIISGIKGKKPIKEEVSDILKKIQSHQGLIDEQLNDVSSHRLSQSFEKRSIELKKDLLFWKRSVFGIVTILVLFNLLSLIGIPLLNELLLLNNKIDLDFWLHIEIISPFLVLLFFTILEHGRIKKILDEYNFKYISARSMSSFFELIDDRNEEEAIKFLIGTINSIYKNPSSKINIESKNSILDYIPDFFKGIKSNFNKLNIKIPDIEGEISIGKNNIKINK